MRKLLNTLYIMTPETYLALENDNVIVLMDENVMGKFPLSYIGADCLFRL